MEWLFLTAVLVLCVYHRTFRRVVVGVGLVTALGFGLLLYQSRPQPTAQPASGRGESLYNELYGAPPTPARALRPEERATMEQRLKQIEALEQRPGRSVSHAEPDYEQLLAIALGTPPPGP